MLKGLTVVPGVIIHQGWTIREASNLISIIPPTHNHGILRRVLPQPVISFAEIIDDILTSISLARRKDDGWRRISARRDPRAVQNKDEQQEGCVEQYTEACVDTENSSL